MIAEQLHSGGAGEFLHIHNVDVDHPNERRKVTVITGKHVENEDPI